MFVLHPIHFCQNAKRVFVVQEFLAFVKGKMRSLQAMMSLLPSQELAALDSHYFN